MSGQLIIGVGGNQSSSSSIPKNSVTSDMVKSIVVTDSAPIKEDNVLYFEYEPVSSVVLRSSAEKKIPRFSNAEIKNKFIKNNFGILNLILENPTDNTYKRVRILLRNNSNEKSQTINITSDFNFGNQPRDLIITIQTNSPNIDPDLQVKFSLLVTQQVDNTRVVATFDNKKSLYSNTSSQYVKQS